MFLLRLIWAVVHALFAKRADLVATFFGRFFHALQNSTLLVSNPRAWDSSSGHA